MDKSPPPKTKSEIAREKGAQRREEEARLAKEKAKRGGRLSHYEVAGPVVRP